MLSTAKMGFSSESEYRKFPFAAMSASAPWNCVIGLPVKFGLLFSEIDRAVGDVRIGLLSFISVTVTVIVAEKTLN